MRLEGVGGGGRAASALAPNHGRRRGWRRRAALRKYRNEVVELRFLFHRAHRAEKTPRGRRSPLHWVLFPARAPGPLPSPARRPRRLV